MVTLRRYLNLDEAERDKNLLDAAGIPAFVAGEASATAGYAGILGEIQLQVNDADLERARHVLKESKASPPLPDDFVPPEQPPAETTSAGIVAIVNMVVTCVVVGLLVSAAFMLRDWRRRSFTGTTHRDLNHDGHPDAWYHYENGKYLAAEQDRNFNGFADQWWHYENDAVTHSEADNNFDGKPDVWWTFRNGNPIVADVDTDFDGVPDAHCVYVNGVLAECDCYEKTGAVFRHENYQHGIRYEELLDEDGDGWFERKITYDSLQRPIKTESIHQAVPPTRR